MFGKPTTENNTFPKKAKALGDQGGLFKTKSLNVPERKIAGNVGESVLKLDSVQLELPNLGLKLETETSSDRISRSPKSPLERVRLAGVMTFCDANEANRTSPKHTARTSPSRMQTVQKRDPSHRGQRSTSPRRQPLSAPWSAGNAKGFSKKNRAETVED